MSMITTTVRGRLAAGLAATALLFTAACGGATVNSGGGGVASGAPSGGAGAACGTVNLAMNDWVGYTADAAVVTYVAETKLGCKVNQKALKEEIAWGGFASGQVDVVIENWDHPDLVKKYIDQQKVAVDGGPTGNLGKIGWFVPPWLAAEHPDILDYKNLNKYAEQFKTSESGDKGQLLDGDPSFVSYDEALVKTLDLNFKVVYGGSETALTTAFKDAEANKKWMIGYFYEPHWFFSEVPIKRITLPPYTDGCAADAAKVACDYEELKLNKIMAAKFAESGSPAVTLIKNFKWTNDDQDLVAKYITADKMKPAEAAKKWIDANPDKVEAWLPK